MAVIISFLSALTHSRSFSQSISLQHPGENWPPDLVSTVLFCNTLLISLVGGMSSKLHTHHTSFREEWCHIRALSWQLQLRTAQWQNHFSNVYFIQSQKVLQLEESAEESEQDSPWCEWLGTVSCLVSGAEKAVQTQHYQHCWNNCSRSLDKQSVFVTYQSLNSSNINVSSLLITNRWMKCFTEVGSWICILQKYNDSVMKISFSGVMRRKVDTLRSSQILVHTYR